jgi:hypothetical protein
MLIVSIQRVSSSISFKRLPLQNNIAALNALFRLEAPLLLSLEPFITYAFLTFLLAVVQEN